MKSIVFIDTEISPSTKKIMDIGAIDSDDRIYHGGNTNEFSDFIKDYYYICGHNIVAFDSVYIEEYIKQRKYIYVDTLAVSPLIYPKQVYHKLLKDDKIIQEELNNPVNDSKKARDLFYKEVEEFNRLDNTIKAIFGSLLANTNEFKGFFEYVGAKKCWNLKKDIINTFKGKICSNADLGYLINNFPVELAYALALINIDEKHEVFSPWVQIKYPRINHVMKTLRGTSCGNCPYCNKKLNSVARLQEIFGYKGFRKFNDEPLQETAVNAAIAGKSLLAVFPTGGGKSLTFQLPALIAGEADKGLTVIISPLQSLMKDQVDNLEKRGISDAVTINGLLGPVERKEAMDRVYNGLASMLYISPELLRSKSIEKLLLARNISRIVIDEAHCFSAWGQDFRVDYLYIGDFIKELQKKKGIGTNIPVSCFTATAKQKVIADICDYFNEKLGLKLEIFATSAQRENLHYKVELKDSDDDKYTSLRELIRSRNCPTIVYASRTKTTLDLAQKLRDDGFTALAFNGKMDRADKVANQEAFIKNEVQVMVATSAFGMGVDKDDVKLVVHYEISDSLENYVQEAGRAGRNTEYDAECVVYYNENDLNKHFEILNRSKLSLSDISQIWRAIKAMTKKRDTLCCSALELARAAGWNEEKNDSETRVKTAIAALEASGYVTRGMNSPRIFATSIQVKNVVEARKRMEKSKLFTDEEMNVSATIISSLIGKKTRAIANNDDSESRVDYIADNLGIEKSIVITLIDKMRQAKILADNNDMTAFIKSGEEGKVDRELLKYAEMERYLLKNINPGKQCIDLKKLNDSCIREGKIKGSTVKIFKSILLFWVIKGYMKKTLRTLDTSYELDLNYTPEEISKKSEDRFNVAFYVLEYLFNKKNKDNDAVLFSMNELLYAYNNRTDLFNSSDSKKIGIQELQDSLLYLTKCGIMSIEGGFLVLYNAMQIKRLVMDNKIQYKQDDYKTLKEHYELKIQQIHIVGEYANMMVRNYDEALEYVNDYFQLQYDGFIKKYFKGNRRGEIKRNITPARYNKLFGELSDAQREIIDDEDTKYITVLAGPGSGKTRVLVHKLAALLLLEDVKSEQLLMLTFSRAAATEFKERLLSLIGDAAHYVDIKTFHSYAFDLLGKIGNSEEFDEVVPAATKMILSGEVEPEKIAKTVLVIDEAQDMSEKDFALVESLISINPEMKVIAVGDDDQNIYEFRDSNSKYMAKLTEYDRAKSYELIANYRSAGDIVGFTNSFVKRIIDRLKSTDIEPAYDFKGVVSIIECKSENLYQPVVTSILANNDSKKKIAILTQTNEEALKLLSLLELNGLRAKLIQTNDGFNLYNLSEMRYFIRKIEKNSTTPIITDQVWREALDKLVDKYQGSTSLDFVLKLINKYSSINKEKYKTDFLEYVKESNFEDFVDYNNTNIIVSTIHKSKGHEFDSVYLMLNRHSYSNDSEMRALYVGMTRAKSALYIYTSNNMFRAYRKLSNYSYDNNYYEEPNELILELTHRDINLGLFKNDNKKIEILNMKAGMPLVKNDDYLGATNGTKKLFKLSQSFTSKLNELEERGYIILNIETRYILAWHDKDDLDEYSEYAIILPTMYLKKTEAKEEPKVIKQEEICYDIDLSKTNVEKLEADKVDIEKNEIISRLNELRLMLAKKEDKAIEEIFSDNTLYEIIKEMPETTKDLEKVYGMNSYLASYYGINILKAIWADEYDAIRKKNDKYNGNILASRFRKYRMTKAKNNNLRPFNIFPDSVLDELLAKLPRTKEELNLIKGLGPNKIGSYGDEIVKIINDYLEENSDKKPVEPEIEVSEKREAKVIDASYKNLMEKLKEFRLKVAKEEGLLPYMIFNNAQMQDLLNKMPKNKDELLKVHGFGVVKSNKYGEQILKILNSK